MTAAPRSHLAEYLMEALGLGLFLMSAALFGTLLEFPGSPIHRMIAAPFIRRALMGVAMGLTLIALVYSPWGQQSGAHLNPVVTLTFWRLGKVAPRDAVCYPVAQFVGGAVGAVVAGAFFDNAFL